MTVLQGRVLGGTTLINNCICFRLDEPRHRARRHAGAAGRAPASPIDPAGARAPPTTPSSAHARRRAHPPERLDHGNGRLLLDGWRALRRPRRGWTRRCPRTGSARTSTTAAPSGVCNWGCPHDRKGVGARDLRDARRSRAGARVMTESHVAPDRDRRGARDRGPRLRHGERDVPRPLPAPSSWPAGRSARARCCPAQRRTAQRRHAPVVQRGHGDARALPGAASHAYDGDQMTAYVDAGDLPARELVPAAGRRTRISRARAGSGRTSTACATTRATRAAASSSAPTTTGASSTRRSCATCSARSSTG